MITGEPRCPETGTSGSAGGRTEKDQHTLAPRRAAHPTEFGKDCFGLDQCQVRLYTAIIRHVVLVMAALAICAVTAAQLKDRTNSQPPPPVRPDQPPPADPGMISLTVPEIKRLLAAALLRPHPPGHNARWLNWRRRHQARSRWFHQRTRLNRNYALVS